MGSKYQRQNSRTITRAFRRLATSKDVVIEKGMRELLQKAVIYALQSHDSDHVLHTLMGDSYGWLLMHDGKHVAHEVTTGRMDKEGYAEVTLMAVSKEVKQEGWVGVVMAGMRSDSVTLFEVDYEESILRETADHVLQSFGKYFKPIKR